MIKKRERKKVLGGPTFLWSGLIMNGRKKRGSGIYNPTINEKGRVKFWQGER